MGIRSWWKSRHYEANRNKVLSEDVKQAQPVKHYVNPRSFEAFKTEAQKRGLQPMDCPTSTQQFQVHVMGITLNYYPSTGTVLALGALKRTWEDKEPKGYWDIVDSCLKERARRGSVTTVGKKVVQW